MQNVIDAYSFRLKCLKVNKYFTLGYLKNEIVEDASDVKPLDNDTRVTETLNSYINDFKSENSADEFEHDDYKLENYTEILESDKNNPGSSTSHDIDAKIDELFVKMRTKSFQISPIVCEFCEKEFNSMRGLRYHIETHRSGLKYKCKRCKGDFRTHMQLVRHKRIHRKNLFHCPECPQIFPVVNLLVKHIKKSHLKLDNGEVFPCLSCDEVFMHKTILEVSIENNI